ncbi:MAG: Rrf2 family transcriptional regulator [Candidatus Omnitrophica bacterium]|nr:Rrf2 family transcriptional regulator [Candidatus Omnitrophota bacterium]
MRISKRTRYGVRLMLALAFNYARGATFLKNIAKEEEISEKYLSQIAISLKVNNLILANRGAHGGYMLARPPKDINIKEIVETLEGKPAIVDCSESSYKCKRNSICAAKYVWIKLKNSISETLSAITLEDLIEMQGKEQNIPAYNI